MKSPVQELLSLTEKLIAENKKLDRLERKLANLTADVYFSESVQARTNAEARGNEVTKRLEAENAAFLDDLYTTRGLAREYRLRREALIIAIKFGGTIYEK